MKLNNHGWGTKEFLIAAAIIFGLLLFISYEVNRFYMGIDSNIETKASNTKKVNRSYYTSYEKKVSDAAISYVVSNGVAVPDAGERVYISDLVDMGYVDNLYDYYSKRMCSGYAIVRDYNNNLSARSYIKCSNYTTEGY